MLDVSGPNGRAAQPLLVRVAQKLPSRPLADPGAELVRALEPFRSDLAALRGRRVLVGVPSRGIDRMAELLRTLGGYLREAGVQPAVVPAMGSHGQGTPVGQVRQLLALGLGEAETGLPLVEPSDYRPVATHADGGGLFLPAEVREAAGLLLVNRVKLHTLFGGPLQSGLCKILAFGLGGPLGAAASHRNAEHAGLLATASEALEKLRAPARLLFGVALVEDATHRLAHVEVVPAEQLAHADVRLLPLAAEMHPRLPLRHGALLIVERMGKDLSGTGMDPHVIGRPPAAADRARFRRVFVRSLTEATHGNALGIGYADHTLESLVRAMDREATELNARTSGSHAKARVPEAVHATDRGAVGAALAAAGHGPILQIRDTLHVGEALAAGYEPHELETLECLETLGPLSFEPDGRLTHLLGARRPQP